MKHKQEMASLKADLQKLQHESKSGLKGKDAAQKELDTTRSATHKERHLKWHRLPAAELHMA
jgi:hypothetical protein